MFTYSVDPRSNQGQIGCGTCCCEKISLRPGEENLINLNYAPWSVPIGNGVELLGDPEVSITADDGACSTASIDNFAPPSATVAELTTAQNMPVQQDLTGGAITPVANTFSIALVPFASPKNGTVVIDNSTGIYTYTPNNGFVGYDSFYITITDAQGRSINRQQRVTVGTPTTGMQVNEDGRGVIVARQEIEVNTRMHTTSIPVRMSFLNDGCSVYKLQVKQTARDCNGRLFSHFWCADITNGKC